MSILLLIDPQGLISPVLEESVAGTGVTVKVVDSPHSAKVSLLEILPSLILTPIVISDQGNAGLSFCEELRDHQNFSGIPVVLLADKVDETVSESARNFGAQAVLPFPILASELRKLLSEILPNVISGPETVQVREQTLNALENAEQINQNFNNNIQPEAILNANNIASNAHASGMPVDPALQNAVQAGANPFIENLNLAQRILATVLHNLKTSDLLSVVSQEEVPAVVHEMTKTVCEINDSEISVSTEETSSNNLSTNIISD